MICLDFFFFKTVLQSLVLGFFLVKQFMNFLYLFSLNRIFFLIKLILKKSNERVDVNLRLGFCSGVVMEQSSDHSAQAGMVFFSFDKLHIDKLHKFGMWCFFVFLISLLCVAGPSNIPLWKRGHKVGTHGWGIPSGTKACQTSNDASLFTSSLPVLPHAKCMYLLFVLMLLAIFLLAKSNSFSYFIQ